MAQNKKPKKTSTNKRWMWIVILLIVAAGVVGYFLWNHNQQANAAQAAAATPDFQTTTVRRGDITLSASGTGTLTAGRSNQLSFPIAGTVAKLNVQAGDQVKKGQVLAQLDNIDQLQAAVNSAQQDLITAQQTVDTYKQSAAANLANAQLAVINDQKAVTDAQSKLIKPGMQRCDQTTLDAYYYKYVSIKNQLDALGDGGGNSNYYLNTILPMKNKVAQAYAAYQWCEGFTQYELDSSHAKLDIAAAKQQQDQTTLDILKKNNGLDPITLAQDENKVATAQLALNTAKQNLDGAIMKAPYDGTILSISGQSGDSIGTTSFITIVDYSHPQVQFAVDETDMSKVALGEEAQVVFDSSPNQTFTGKVVQINPSLVTANNIQTVQGLIELDLSKAKEPPLLLQGMTGTVTLIRSQANNVLLVPAQAVRDLGNETFGVFVVGPDNQLKLTIVQTGLQDLANVEIKSGLNTGDVVSTGTSQIKQSQSNSQ
jgi:HlyD family secretion protein